MRQTGMPLAAFAALGLGGCTTHLESGRASPGSIPQGVVYHLPHLLYDVDVTREVISCPATPGALVEFKMTAKATPRVVAGEPIVIAYEELASVTKTSDLTIELYANGTLKSINLTVDDKTADLAAETFKAAVSVGKIAFGLPPDAGTSDRSTIGAYLACTPDTERALAGLPDLRRKVREAEADLKTKTKALSDYQTEHPEAQRTPADTTEIKKRTDAKAAAQENLDEANKKLTDGVASLTVQARFVVSPRRGQGGQVSLIGEAQSGSTKPSSLFEARVKLDDNWLALPLNDAMTIDQSTLMRARWASAGAQGEPVAAADRLWRNDALRTLALSTATETDRAGVVVAIEPVSLSTVAEFTSLPEMTGCGSGKAPRCGILYRTKAPARTRICKSEGKDEALAIAVCNRFPGGAPQVLFSEDRSIPQLGQLASLGLRNEVFANTVLTGEWNEEGSLLKFGYERPRATAVEFAKTVNSGLDSATTLISYAKGSELRDLGYEKQLNDARAAVLTSAKPLQQPSEVTQVQNATGLLDAERLRVEAEINLIKKRRELEALKAEPDEEQD